MTILYNSHSTPQHINHYFYYNKNYPAFEMETKPQTKSDNSPLTDDNPSPAASLATKRKTPEATETASTPKRRKIATDAPYINKLTVPQFPELLHLCQRCKTDILWVNWSMKTTPSELLDSTTEFEEISNRCLQTITPVTLTKCAINTNKYLDTLQVIVKGNSSDTSTIGTTMITLVKLHEQNEHTKVNLVAKVIEVKPQTTVATGKIKQVIVLADSTGDSILTLWEEHIGEREEQKTYSSKKLDVRTLAILPHASAMIPADDIHAKILELTIPNKHTLATQTSS